MEDQTFQLLLVHLEEIKAQNNEVKAQNVEQLKLLAAHIKDDAEVAKIVDRHSTYFAGIGAVHLPLLGYVINVIASKLGLK